jgi:hypothetical protein
MLHVPATEFVGFAIDTPAPAAAPKLPKLHPWQYLRLRREAAGLSVDDVATRLSPRLATRSDCAAFVRLLETRNYTARKMRPIKRLASVIPLDVNVYRQLASGDRDRDPPICRTCGASYWDPGRRGKLGILEWAADGKCTGCADEQAAAA